jgi:hypothetical protein
MEIAQMKGESRAVSLSAGLANLCADVKTQSQEHIKPIHGYCAGRLILEGGFPPEWVYPRQSFSSKKVTNGIYELSMNPSPRIGSERRVLGGIKYKDIDVTVLVPGLGPALGISAKSTGNAFRNLTNRMEEALGDCTNIYLMYPGFVFGFLHLIRFNKVSEVASVQDASFDKENRPLPSIRRYHEVLVALSGRNTITDPGMRYEGVCMLVYRCGRPTVEIWNEYPPKESPVHFSNFFQRLYNLYDLRFAYPEPNGPNIRKEWRVTEKGLAVAFDREVEFSWEPRLAD